MEEATDVEVEEFEDDGNTWKSAPSLSLLLYARWLTARTSPFASQVIRAVDQVKKPDHWPREFAKRVKERQKSLLEDVQVKSQAMSVPALTHPPSPVFVSPSLPRKHVADPTAPP